MVFMGPPTSLLRMLPIMSLLRESPVVHLWYHLCVSVSCKQPCKWGCEPNDQACVWPVRWAATLQGPQKPEARLVQTWLFLCEQIWRRVLCSFPLRSRSSLSPCPRSESWKKIKPFSNMHMKFLQNTLYMTIKMFYSIVLLLHFSLALSSWELSIPPKYQQMTVRRHGTYNDTGENEIHHSAAYAYISSNIIARCISKLTSYHLWPQVWNLHFLKSERSSAINE